VNQQGQRTECDPDGALEAVRERERVLFDAAPHGIVFQDAQGRILSANPAAERILGLSLAQMQGRTSLDPGWRAIHEDGTPFPGDTHPAMETLRTGRVIENTIMGILSQDQAAATWISINTTPLFLPGQERPFQVCATFVDITQRKQAEGRLKRTLEHLQLGHQAAKAGAWEWDLKTGENQWLDTLWELYGLEPGQVTPSYEAWVKLLHPADRSAAQAYLKEGVAKGADLDFEWRVVHPSGEVRWLLSRGRPLRDAEGRVVRYLGIVVDITERKQAEARARASRAQLDAALESMTDAVFISDTQGRFIEFNEAFATFHRFPNKAACSRTFTDYPDLLETYGPDGRPRPLDQWVTLRALRGEAGTNLEYTLRRKDTGETWVGSFSFGPIRDPEGHIVGAVVTARDITASKAAEQSLKESEERFRTVFEASPDAVLIREMDGRFLEANAVALKRYGYTREEFLRMKPEDLVPSSLRDQIPLRVAECLTSGLPFEWVHEAKDGRLIPVELQLSRFSLRGKPCILACARDISERKAAEEDHAKLQAELQHAQKLESLGILAGGVAHDMNNVLGAILAMATVHQRKAAEDSALHRDMGTIIQACQRGGSLAKGLLGFARKNLSEECEVDLNTVVREGISLLSQTTFQHVQLVTDLDELACYVKGDPASLSHALMNLCVNAVDAMPEPGTLLIRTRREGATAVLEVADTGLGMPREVLEKAMDPFFTTKPQGKGTGLGLPIVYGTVKAHHGRIDIKSEPGQGTTVRIELPSHEGAVLPVAAVPEPLPKPDQPLLNLLLVDDDELIQMAIQSLLEILGHRVTTVSSGEEALARLEAGLHPDLIILDMNMPGLGGAGTLPEIRRLLSEVPVLLATGRSNQGAEDLVASHPGVTLLAKPFTLEELRRQLDPATRG
jgi:PAS domain S-box-containing protein